MNSLKNMISENNQYIYDVVKDFIKCNDIDNWENFSYDCCYVEHPDDIEMRSGASKLVLIPIEEQFVIKIPYYGEGDCGWIFPYTGAYNEALEEKGYSTKDNNYCALEANLYTEAVKCDCAQFFVPVLFFDTIKGFPVYIQSKATPDFGKNKSDNTDNTYKYASIKNSDIFDPEIGSRLVDFYSTYEIEKFLNFIKTYHINDIGNYRNGGYSIEASRYVFWDFSGFYN